MKTVFVHIGLHKTGTTTIQDYLIDNIEPLEAHGVFVPFAHRNHNLTLWVNGQKNTQKRQNQWARLIRKINKSELDTTVLSSEFFSRDISELEDWDDNFHSLIDHGYQVKFILYLRRSDKRFESLFIEAIKGGNGLTDIREFPYVRFIDNWLLCQSIIEKFGSESLIVRKFEIDAKEGLIKSFLNCIGVKDARVDESKYQTNTKPSLDQLRAIQYAGELFGKLTESSFNSARQRRKAIKRWTKWFMEETSHWEDKSSYSLLPNDIATMILKDQFESNSSIANAFFDGDLTHLNADDLPDNEVESLSIIKMNPIHLDEALGHFKQVDIITQAMNTDPTT